MSEALTACDDQALHRRADAGQATRDRRQAQPGLTRCAGGSRARGRGRASSGLRAATRTKYKWRSNVYGLIQVAGPARSDSAPALLVPVPIQARPIQRDGDDRMTVRSDVQPFARFDQGPRRSRLHLAAGWPNAGWPHLGGRCAARRVALAVELPPRAFARREVERERDSVERSNEQVCRVRRFRPEANTQIE